MHATAGGHDEVVQLLLAHGARPGEMDHSARSVLHWAVLAKRESCLATLLTHMASHDPLLIDSYDKNGRTPLHIAVYTGFEQGVSILLRHGANLHSRARKIEGSLSS